MLTAIEVIPGDHAGVWERRCMSGILSIVIRLAASTID